MLPRRPPCVVHSNVTFCDIHTEQLNGVDQNFIKLFEIAQLMLEWV